ncbi:MAG: SDR family NAD(P)-dependent oxidoreductase [Microthrixaceae bacterium]
MELTSGTAIVTGAAGGIGSDIAARLASEGMSIVLADIDAARLESVRESLAANGATVAAVAGDVAQRSHHAELVAAAENLDGLRLSVLNAGISLPGLSWEEPIDRWELTVDVNFWGVIHGLRAALNTMVERDDGWVVAVSSGAGLVATPGLAPYVATKHAINGAVESTHHELRRIESRVGVSVVCPGSIATAGEDYPPMSGLDASVGSSYPAVVRDLQETTARGVINGADPASVSDALVDGVTQGRFWILPQPEVAWAATDRARRIAEGDVPVDLLG